MNTRHPGYHKENLIADANSYINYLQNKESDEHLLPDLVEFLHALEAVRNNSILNYLPEYETFFKKAGY